MVLDTISDPISNHIFAFYGRATTITSRDIVGDCVAGISIDLAGTGICPPGNTEEEQREGRSRGRWDYTGQTWYSWCAVDNIDEKPEVQLNGLAKEEERAAVAPVNGDQPGSIQTTAASLDIGGKPEAGTKVPGGPPVGGVLQRPGPSACPSVLASPPMFGAAPVNGQGAKGLRGGPPPLALTPQGLTPQGMNPQGMASQGLAGPAPAQYRTAAFLSRYSTTLPPQASGPYHAGYGQPQTNDVGRPTEGLSSARRRSSTALPDGARGPVGLTTALPSVSRVGHAAFLRAADNREPSRDGHVTGASGGERGRAPSPAPLERASLSPPAACIPRGSRIRKLALSTWADGALMAGF
ncbi:hypothetical protein HPB47_006246 [Ixodes persulcatus]|uniref:Uncharacterized protein n=1 Tax=Ixodes persulcatus TaxID=34615 RepID=A0AC60PB17_IXOPE|nr:hypothetical protein HPB47_006246 [Ixodes persulcatus]